VSRATNHRHGESAAHLLVANVPRAAEHTTVGATLELLRRERYDSIELLCVLGANERLQGVVPANALPGAAPDLTLGALMLKPAPAVHAHTDQERVASVGLHHGLSAVPVIDAQGHLLGVVPSLALLKVLREEHVEDLHRLAGIRGERAQARHALEAPPVRRARDRLPWLIVGLLGSVATTLIMARFEATMRAQVSVAFFVPGLVYLADAIGTQTEAIAVRGLSLSHAPIRRLLGGELRTGLLIGLSLGLIALLLTWLAFGDIRLAATIALALFVASTGAAGVGLVLPWLLAACGRDPAYGSGPLATIVQDVLSLAVYFGIATWLLT
jgi:magnesium transporter